MSLQRRLLLYLLICAPLVWSVALYFSIQRARHEVNEMFDTQLIRLARQVYSTAGHGDPNGGFAVLPAAPQEGTADAGESDVRDLAVAVWNAKGGMAMSDREGVDLPYRPTASGFVDEEVAGRLWRVYYLQTTDGRWLVAAGQGAYERDELVYGLTITQVVPWLLVLPVLLLVMTWAVRRALAPMRQLTDELSGRDAQELQAVPDARAPSELKPLLSAMNGLFSRIEQLLVRERRFTADAAHELRTPIAVLRAQWDVLRRTATPVERQEAEAKLGAGLDRMERLVTQMLALSRVESGAAAPLRVDVDWCEIVEDAMSDCLALAERRRIDLACEWPAPGIHALPLLGDAPLLTVMLRNLLDNAVRYAPTGSSVVLRIDREHLDIENEGPPLSAEQIQRAGERFYRPDGQTEVGSGLGLSIVRRIAQLHGLELVLGPRADGRGVRALVQFDAAHR